MKERRPIGYFKIEYPNMEYFVDWRYLDEVGECAVGETINVGKFTLTRLA